VLEDGAYHVAHHQAARQLIRSVRAEQVDQARGPKSSSRDPRDSMTRMLSLGSRGGSHHLNPTRTDARQRVRRVHRPDYMAVADELRYCGWPALIQARLPC
jgi:hypothetical protein